MSNTLSSQEIIEIVQKSEPKGAESVSRPPFAGSHAGFIQAPPVLQNQYTSDPVLKSVIAHFLPSDFMKNIEDDMIQFGEFVVSPEMLTWCKDAESNPPKMLQFDAWGKRIDELITSNGWKNMKKVAALSGIVAIAYERDRWGQHARFYQFAKYFLYSPSSAMFTCPLAMTDGAARLLEQYATQELYQRAYPHLTSRDPEQFWCSGQWMTERPGGSDVGRTETRAIYTGDAVKFNQAVAKATSLSEGNTILQLPMQENVWNVHGLKWFSSATDSDMTLLLARQHDPVNDKLGMGSRGLSLFYAEIRDPDVPIAPKTSFSSHHRPLNKIRIQRLKDKLGTKPVPTAELELIGTKAHMVGTPGRGVATIATILNITRVHCAVGSTSFVGRAWNTVRDWAWKREASGKRLVQLPLHLTQLAHLGLGYRACAGLSFYVVQLLGKTEWDWYQQRKKHSGPLESPVVGEDPNDATLLRLMTPVAKTWVSRTAVQLISEAMECMGGQGYMEDAADLPRLWRDAMVNVIWEGTTSVMALDVLRVLKGSKGHAWKLYIESMQNMISGSNLSHAKDQLTKSLQVLTRLAQMIIQGDGTMERASRELTFAMGRITSGCILLDLAKNDEAAKIAAERWNVSADALLGPVLQEVGMVSVSTGTLKVNDLRGDILLGLGEDLDMNGIVSRL